MESYPTNGMNIELSRLASFHKYPLASPEGASVRNQLYLSPLKLARAGFHREHDLEADEVVCFSCCLKVKNWEGESPMAVHRILRPDCRCLKQIYTTPSRTVVSLGTSTDTLPSLHNVRRELFPESTDAHTDSRIPQRLSILSIDDPLSCHAVENDLLLFENHRLMTFVNPIDSMAQAWAKEGFIADLSDQDLMVKCVFCGQKTSFSAGSPREVHEEISPNCPLVRYFDVGNISRELEEKVRMKYGVQHRQQSSAYHRHPQFQELDKRLETFRNWPFLQQSILPKEALAEAGFFFSGCADKVECYSCGFGLRNWRPGANPWQQHARVRPSCLHLSQHAEPVLLQTAADCQILCDSDPPKEGELSCEGEVRSATSVLPQLSLEGVEAALACGYRIEAVRQAVTSIFLATRGYPNYPLLVGKLQASEANFGLLQQQSSQIQQQSSQIQQQSSQIQQHVQELQQERHTHMQEKDSYQQEMQAALQQKDLLVQQKDLLVQQKDLLVQQKEWQCQRVQRELAAKCEAHQREMSRLSAELQGEQQRRTENLLENICRQGQELSHKDQELSRNRQELSRNRQELSRNRQELSRKDQLIERLAEFLQQKGLQLPPLDQEMPAEVVPLGEGAHPPHLPSPPPSPHPSPLPLHPPLQKMERLCPWRCCARCVFRRRPQRCYSHVDTCAVVHAVHSACLTRAALCVAPPLTGGTWCSGLECLQLYCPLSPTVLCWSFLVIHRKIDVYLHTHLPMNT